MGAFQRKYIYNYKYYLHIWFYCRFMYHLLFIWTRKTGKLQDFIYIKNSGNFIKKMKNIGTIPLDSILITANVKGLYPSIPHEAGFKALEKALSNCDNENISTEDLVKMAKFAIKNNYFEFNGFEKSNRN